MIHDGTICHMLVGSLPARQLTYYSTPNTGLLALFVLLLTRPNVLATLPGMCGTLTITTVCNTVMILGKWLQ